MSYSPGPPEPFPDYSCVLEVCLREASGLAAFAKGEALMNETGRASAFQELAVPQGKRY